jgi:drug/metabolite transporter (DMT)-like permease
MSNTVTKDYWSGVVKMFAAMLLMGTVGYFVIESKQQAHNVVFFRCLFGVVFLSAYCLIAGIFKNTELTKKNFVLISLSGVFLVCNWIMLFESFKTASISISTTIYHIQPFLFVIIWSAIFRESVPKEKWILMFLAFVGVVYVIDIDTKTFDFSSSYVHGVLLAISAALFWAISAIMVKQIKAVRPHLIVLIQLAVGVFILFPFADLKTAEYITNIQWGYLLTLGAVHSCITYVLMYSAYRNLSASTIAIMTFIYPAVAILVDFIFYNKSLNILQMVGVALIVASSYMANQNVKIFPVKK